MPILDKERLVADISNSAIELLDHLSQITDEQDIDYFPKKLTGKITEYKHLAYASNNLLKQMKAEGCGVIETFYLFS